MQAAPWVFGPTGLFCVRGEHDLPGEKAMTKDERIADLEAKFLAFREAAIAFEDEVGWAEFHWPKNRIYNSSHHPAYLSGPTTAAVGAKALELKCTEVHHLGKLDDTNLFHENENLTAEDLNRAMDELGK